MEWNVELRGGRNCLFPTYKGTEELEYLCHVSERKERIDWKCPVLIDIEEGGSRLYQQRQGS